MTNWSPREVMGPIKYLKFKIRRWVRVSSVPEWVSKAEGDYYKGFQKKYGHRPYDEEKVFVGENLKYKVKFVAISQGEIMTMYYVKIK